MLAQLTISNFAIVRELEIDFHSGMTAITGETGAGKSIAIDALGLCLGGRAEGDMVRRGANRADLCARFSLKDTPAALRWLEENQLEDGRECLLRRVISSDGRSRGFINGTAVPLSQLRELGQLLIQIHGQHAHQQLINRSSRKRCLMAMQVSTHLLSAWRSTIASGIKAAVSLPSTSSKARSVPPALSFWNTSLKNSTNLARRRVNLSLLTKSTSAWLTAVTCSQPARMPLTCWLTVKT